ncbi:MAG: hypothetical protein IPG23_15625 [Burkholderiales bacterium]|jgi:hypothetical protein|nr:hypothetical protein [Burkholderiales bacterium]
MEQRSSRPIEGGGATVVMATKPKFKSDVLAAIHASATALQQVGAIDQATMRKFDASCLAVAATLAGVVVFDR